MREVDKQEKNIPNHTAYDYYTNGVNNTIDGTEVDEIIEEIINIMRKHKVTVETSRQILKDTISSIEKETVIT